MEPKNKKTISRKELRKKTEKKRPIDNIDEMDDFELEETNIGYQMTNSRIFNHMIKIPLFITLFLFVFTVLAQIFYTDYAIFGWIVMGVLMLPIVIGFGLILNNIRHIRKLEEARFPYLVEYHKSLKKEA